MARIQTGSASPYVKASLGGDANPMKFYATTYTTSYNHEGFKPQQRQLLFSTGYKSNFRPAVYYTNSLDRLDNPVLGYLFQDNYASITGKHFMPYDTPTGAEPLPMKTHSAGSGFMRQKPLTFPNTRMVKSVHFDTQDHGPQGIGGIRPKHAPVLHKLQSHDPVQHENARHGPQFMSTETKSKYRQSETPLEALSHLKFIGSKQNTGHTEGSPLSPVTYHPPSAYRGALPGHFTDRPTGVSITITDYLPSATPHGDEFLPALASRTERETGFSREKARVSTSADLETMKIAPTLQLENLKKADPSDYLNAVDPSMKNTVTQLHFQGEQRCKTSEPEFLGRCSIGEKESTGFSTNNKGHVVPVRSIEDSDRYLTDYNIRFFDKTVTGPNREGWTRGGIQSQVPDGYITNNRAWKFGVKENTLNNLRRLHPHVARTMLAVDRFYDDHTYDCKERPVEMVA
ncbi:protein phosphatase 1 regulatory subunit 32 [Protopterus annectens]|uniref:protein phosphatase 1 regulatory subunit 32 n=1 Tax=Protopterus annectens TaxID=7888 RepID=UPI001CFB88E7|nr:protein phosphatase 1 regulatory subunit 32 [Protopterus annectens]XP_043915587.1 protein phosphatase 1 regulatory subunit 32 [Protopterus annectens]